MVKKILNNRHLWAVSVLEAGVAFLCYFDRVIAIPNSLSWLAVERNHYSVFLFISLIPILYAALFFRFRGGLILCGISALILLPRAAIVLPQKPEILVETAAFLGVSVLLSWITDRSQNIITRLETAQTQLSSSLSVIQRQQEQLKISEEKYRDLFESAGEAIFVCSPDGRIVMANHAAQNLTGLTREKLLAVNFQSLFNGNEKEPLFDTVPDGRDQTRVKTQEQILVRKSGEKAFILIRLSPLTHGNTAVGFQAIVRDVTKEKKLQNNLEHFIELSSKAQEEERLRISRELHDETAQLIASLSRGLKSLNDETDGLSGGAREKITKLQALADYALEGIRRFSQELRPSILDDLGMVPAVKWLLLNLKEACSIETNFTVNGPESRLPQQVELAFFRIAQEAMNNIQQHARASKVDVGLSFAEDGLKMTISDNGRGFNVSDDRRALEAGMGILGMQERAKLIGATLQVESETGRGTRISLYLPRTAITRSPGSRTGLSSLAG